MRRPPLIDVPRLLELPAGRDVTACAVDVETNGLSPETSVLSCTAIHCRLDLAGRSLSLVRAATRYYYPVEPFNPGAIRVNGLSEDEIASRRGNATYARHFRDDADMRSFLGGSEVIVGHNVAFDLRFLRPAGRHRVFCTMRAATGIVPVRGVAGRPKPPTLGEAARHYGVGDCAQAHRSLCDACLAAVVFARMAGCGRGSGAFKPCRASDALGAAPT